MVRKLLQAAALFSLPLVAFGYSCGVGEGCSTTEFDLSIKVRAGVTEGDFVKGACASNKPSDVVKMAVAEGFSAGEGVPDYGYTVEIPAFGTLLDDGSRRNLRAAERKLQTIPFVYCAVPGYYPCCVDPVGETCTGRRDLKEDRDLAAVSLTTSVKRESMATSVSKMVVSSVETAMSECLGSSVAVEFTVTERLESRASFDSFSSSSAYFTV